MNAPQEEILDLVNEQDEVIGNMPRSEVHAKRLHNHRFINCFIKNSEGRLWIPRRQKNKKLFPSALDFSVGGHVSSGETYEEAFIREAMEELNLDVTKIPYKILGKLNKPNDGVSAFMIVYEIESNDVPNYNKEDFTEYYWLTPQEILERLDSGDISKEDLPRLLKKFYI